MVVKREKCMLAVDFDGTMIENDCFPGVGEPLPFVVMWLQWYVRLGTKIVLHTCRTGEALAMAIEWCEYNGIELYGVNESPSYPADDDGPFVKPYVHMYIDDKGLGAPLYPGGNIDWKTAGPLIEAFVKLKIADFDSQGIAETSWE